MNWIYFLMDKFHGARLGWQVGYKVLTCDALTGLRSRNFFEMFGRGEVERRSKKNVVAVVAFDVNRFKPVNDQLGHAAGDRLLGILGACVVACLRRSTDAAYRFGGDEVFVFLDGATEKVARKFGKTVNELFLRRASDAFSFLPEGFSLSFGVKLMTREDALQAVLEKVDAEMYADKASQRAL